MSDLTLIASLVLLVAGLAFMLVAAVGFIRLPDVYCRLHVTGILDSLGAPLVLLAAAVWLGPELTAGKLVLGLAFLWTTSPLVGPLLSRAARISQPAAAAAPPPVVIAQPARRREDPSPTPAATPAPAPAPRRQRKEVAA